MKKCKLVVWDLDETFWKGTLSEGEVELIPQNVELVKELTNRGIMNSIVSKNDFEKAIDVLKKWNIADYFVFPKIQWNPKGEIVKSLLEEMKLRAENVLFVDDNHSNRAEVEYYNEGIKTMHPNALPELLDDPAFKGKDDHEHTRLKQYHIMEERSLAETKFSSNEEFLKSSHIKIQICSDCLSEEARIYELIQRTNQLNYTKVRSSEEELHALITDNEIESRYIIAKDDFGEYGIVGFYALKDNRLIHFLFSCRTIGFGIENFLYSKLGYPMLSIEGEVTTPLTKDEKITWIEILNNENQPEERATQKSNLKILMIAGCDLKQATAYLDSSYEIDKEFTTVVNGYEIKTSDLCNLVNTKKLPVEVQHELCDNLPFMAEGVTFGSKLYEGAYNVIIISVVDDYIRGIYKRNDGCYYVGYAGYYDQEERLKRYTDEDLKYLKSNFTFVGKEPLGLFRENLNFILSNIPKRTKVLIINGTDIDVSNWIGKDRIDRNIEMNSVVDDVISNYDNVSLIDMRKIVISESDLTGVDNRHFNRNVYYMMAKEISRQCNEMLTSDVLRIQSRWIFELRSLIGRLIQKIKGLTNF